MSFSDPMTVANYIDNLTRQVPGLQALHRMTTLLLAEHVPDRGSVLVLGAGGGAELKALADAQPTWQLLGVDPSAEMLLLARQTLGADAHRVELIQGYIDDAPHTEHSGATCLLTLHFLSVQARLQTLIALRSRLKPGAPLIIAHHSVPDDPARKQAWLRRSAVFSGATGTEADARAAVFAERLPTLSPEAEEALLQQAGFQRIEQFYTALSFRGWVAYA